MNIVSNLSFTDCRLPQWLIALALGWGAASTASAVEVNGFDEVAKPLLTKHCLKCHRGGEKAKGDLDLSVLTAGNAMDQFEMLESVGERIADGSMPPEEEPSLSAEHRQQFQTWYLEHFVNAVESHPGYFRPRRLCVTEYRNTLRSLLGFDLEVAIVEAEQTVAETSLVLKLMQTDPPGESGFRNDTHGNPLTTVIWNHCSYIADTALEELFSAKRRLILQQITGPIAESGLDADQAELLIRSFVPRAVRRPVPEPKLAAIIQRVSRSQDLESALKFELKAVLMSPQFLYRGLLVDRDGNQRQPVDPFELAERLSYFIWADMPDQTLMQLAGAGKLSDPEVLTQQVHRMLDSPKSRNLADDLATQWLTLDQVAKGFKNPPQAEAYRSQPLDFMHYLFLENRPLMELIDSRTAFINPFTARFYGKDRSQMKRYRKPKGIEVEVVPNQQITLVHTEERGGILTMPGVLEMNRGPVIRGTWILERILGEHLPEPPPDVGQVPANKRGQQLTFRQRFEMHRSKPTCAVCHDKIDPLGFALQRYDGPNYEPDAETDTSGQLPTGEKFEDFQGLKQILVTSQRERVIRNIVERVLSYALCRKLELFDRPTVDQITEDLTRLNGTYRDLVIRVVNSVPFREVAFRD